ncbi:ACT domain-containing protein [bacterium]|nr:ACT domain-containing protein [bacterium]NUN47052.1 ACT domain-containing protein [bacterium]HMV26985.1 ACT domain-containing protein [bacterium]HMW33030.1 ACT domain-containing protein [bacterium]HMW35131.1 ACT domain-containing protein [bacterium]
MNEQEIRKIVEEARRQLGAQASDETVKHVAMEAIRRLDGDKGYVQEHHSTFRYLNRTEGRIIVTAFGKNGPGIISNISQTLTDCRCDILDVSQKIMQEFFTLMMLVDIKNAACPFGTIKENLARTSETLGIRILAQHEDVFKAMHRI